MITMTFEGPLMAQKKKKVLFLGASLVAGFGLPESGTIHKILEAKSKEAELALTFRNEAIAGAASRNGIAQLERAFKENFVPDHLFIGLGISDAVYQTSPEMVQANLKGIISRAREVNPEVQVYLFQGKIFQRHVTSRVAAKGSTYDLAYERVFQDVAAANQVVLLPFILESLEGDMQYFQADRLHPNSVGMKKVADWFWEKARKYF